jgi:hypothetical protein
MKMDKDSQIALLEAVRRKLAGDAKKKSPTKLRQRPELPVPAENRQNLAAKPSNPRALTYPQVDEGPRVPGRPLWMPESGDRDKLPVEIAQAIQEIVQPAYEQLVLHAAPGLERSLGASLVHLLWLEIVEQFDIKREYTTFTLGLELPYNRQQSIDGHIRLLDAKLRHGKFMLRLEELRRYRQAASQDRESPDSLLSSNRLPVRLDPATLLPLDQPVQENGHE